jgi:hypothetical protein
MRFVCTAALGHHGPGHPNLVGKAMASNLMQP